ncbi:DNA polymerase III delta prime subunit [hydrothermal vent metagenome]|uniref:DNA polymerase III subunit delta' n=1 Tax=hydrothermal vent metagenome TaxID=652676 RepID=A0A3B0T4A8_9ZZZZ
MEINHNKQIVGLFKTLIEKKRLGHAYLFSGMESSGKGETAVAIAKLINCEELKESFCDRCPTCLKIEGRSHPDVITIDNEFGESIKIEQIRNILSQVKLRPYMAEKRVIIIENIENFTQESANALLKTLEEPSASSLLVLTTSDLEKCLDTVKSRCHIFLFYPLAHEKLVGLLKEGYDEKPEKLSFSSQYSQGCLGRAKVLLEGGFFEEKNKIIDKFISQGINTDQMKKMLEDKKKTKDFLNIIFSWLHDALLLKTGMGLDNIVHQDRLADLTSFQERYSYEELTGLKDHLITIHKMFNEKFNVSISMNILQSLLKV